MSCIEVLSGGVYTTIQDKGRKGFRSFGIPISGAMDHLSIDLGNSLLGNNLNSTAMEMTIGGPKLLFHNQATICISGADISAKINERPIKTNVSEVIKTGEVLSFGKLMYGCRAYLCVKGGFNTTQHFGSYSTYDQGNLGIPVIKKGAAIPFNPDQISQPNINSRIKPSDSLFNQKAIPVTPGPEYDLINEEFLSEEYEINIDSNRMGYRLSGKKNFSHQSSILTSTVMPGTIQLPPSGNPVILMRDCQTTGGYPRVLQVTEFGINILAQKKPGDKIMFKVINSNCKEHFL